MRENVKKIVVMDGKFWVDLRGNKWSISKYTEKRAALHSQSLVECYNCLNCYLCKYCSNCSNLVNCENCIECCHGFDNKDCYGMMMFSKKTGEMKMNYKVNEGYSFIKGTLSNGALYPQVNPCG